METKLIEGYIFKSRSIPEECSDCFANPLKVKVITCPFNSSYKDIVCENCEKFIREFDGD